MAIKVFKKKNFENFLSGFAHSIQMSSSRMKIMAQRNYISGDLSQTGMQNKKKKIA